MRSAVAAVKALQWSGSAFFYEEWVSAMVAAFKAEGGQIIAQVV